MSNADFKKAFPKRKTKLTWKTCTIFKTKIWKTELRKYWDLIERIEKSKKDVSFRIDRLDIMDSDVFNGHMKNPKGYIDSFEDGKYPMLIEQDLTWKIFSLKISDTWKIKDGRGHEVRNVDFIVLENDKILFWEWHSYLSKGKNVIYAGNLKISWNSWKITSWSNESWHYKPKSSDIIWKNKVVEAVKNSIKDSNGNWNIDLNNYNFIPK